MEPVKGGVKTDQANVQEPSLLQSVLNSVQQKCSDFANNLIVAMKAASSNARTYGAFDEGSGGSSFRPIYFDDQSNVTMGDKIEPIDGESDDAFHSRVCLQVKSTFFGLFAVTIVLFSSATAWARRPGAAETAESKKIDDLKATCQKNGIAFSVKPQYWEAMDTQIAFKLMQKQLAGIFARIGALFAGINNVLFVASDGGNKSVQSISGMQSETATNLVDGESVTIHGDNAGEFGGKDIQDRLLKNTVEQTKQYCSDRFYNSIAPTSNIVMPFFCGSHIYPLCDVDVMKHIANTKEGDKLKYNAADFSVDKTDKKKNPINAFTDGLVSVEAVDMRNALGDVIVKNGAIFEGDKANFLSLKQRVKDTADAAKAQPNDKSLATAAKAAKEAFDDLPATKAFNKLYGMIITHSLIRAHIQNTKTTHINLGVFKVDGKEIKASHYLGEAVRLQKTYVTGRNLDGYGTNEGTDITTRVLRFAAWAFGYDKAPSQA